LIGALIGPFALRLRGNYLAIVSLALVFIGQHVFRNWDYLTGGNSGRSIPNAKIGSIDFGKFEIGNRIYTRPQAYFWLIWALVAIAALLVKNIVRSRPGRAMQAVRDRDVAAEIVGVNLSRTKISAFVISSALAAMAG